MDAEWPPEPAGNGEQMFDLRSDPDEQHNLIGKNSEMENRMREFLLRRLLSTQHTTERPIEDLHR